MTEALPAYPNGGTSCANEGTTTLGLSEWPCLAATPTFAIMALLTGLGGNPLNALCSAAQAAPLNEMTLMYLLMSAFHSPPWLRLGSVLWKTRQPRLSIPCPPSKGNIMKLVRLRAPGGLEHLELVEDDQPEPGPGEVLVRIRASSLNFHDDMVAHGKIPVLDGRVPLSDGAGDVVAVGDGVDAFKIGDAVVSTFWPYWLGGDVMPATRREIPGETVDGYAREFASLPVHFFTKAPAGCTHAEAATLTCAGVTAWRGLVRCGRVKPGDTVLTLGTGGVSLFALQFAKLAGARVIATSSSEEKLEKLKRLGADDVINYKAEPDWGHLAKKLTDGRGVDHVIEVGGPATLTQSIAACRTGGHIALVGVLTGFMAQVSIPALFSNQIRISGISVGSRVDQEDMIRAITANGLKPVIDRSFLLQDIGAAFNHYKSQKHFGKVCLEI
jgi:NADPH:quinone reductase-like Zn-dependent oxidoreductase